MEVKKSLIAVCISSVLMAGTWASATAKTAEDDDSVYQWGRWAVLAPAAGNEEVIAFAQVGTNDLGRCESAETCPTFNVTETPEEPPVATSPCEAGMPCGFARVDHTFDPSQSNNPASSDIVPFELTLNDGAQTVAFVVDRGSVDEIQSATVPASIQTGVVPGAVNTLRGSSVVLRGQIEARDPQATLVRGLWADAGNGGEFVWGVTANASQMQSFIGSLGGDMIANYTGFTQGVINGGEGAVNMAVNFSDATWSGQFNNNAFTASGVVVDSGFVSNAAGFSSNIASGEVYGAFVNAGNNAIGAYDVTDTSGAQSADVFTAGFVNNIPQ